MKMNLHKFSTSIKKITHYLHSPLQIYEHFNRFINIFKHCRPRSLAAVSLHKRPPYCTQLRMPPNTWSVVIFAKIEIPEGLTAILHNNFNSPIRAFFIFLLSSCSAEMKPRIEMGN